MVALRLFALERLIVTLSFAVVRLGFVNLTLQSPAGRPETL
jgi:hypothetical protein